MIYSVIEAIFGSLRLSLDSSRKYSHVLRILVGQSWIPQLVKWYHSPVNRSLSHRYPLQERFITLISTVDM